MIKKSCLGCNRLKTIEEFGVRTRSVDGYADRCLECCRAESRERYAKNPGAGRGRANRYRARYPERVRAAARQAARANKAQRRIDKVGIVARNNDYVNAIKLATGCVECGFKGDEPWLLEFDHVRGTKVEAVSQLVAGAYSLAVIQAEIGKCEVVCQRHHRMRTIARMQERRRTATEPAEDGPGV
ncbi:protein of unknown function [Modestobacter italicus]|uniref:HNH endonuclease n=1 Tax=Modestobacter italicus (strain DSM 44449 / CECT 9708 / BC 501) TaxID=2732864 RepID=I4EX78_MODI5|nr:hypothetical protein [Modestobacter marinus]CCH87991.1 protein of unknown function [Modestobacter marinus]